MATGRPAGALLQTNGVIRTADEDGAVSHLLEMALEAEVGITDGEHFGVHAAVGGVAGGAALAHGFVGKHIRPALSRMTFEAIVILRHQHRAAACVNAALVRRMTEGALHPALGNGMMIRQFELAAHIGVALVANGFPGPGGRHAGRGAGQAGGDGTTRAERIGCFDFTTGIGMQTGRAVAGFAADVLGVGSLGHEPRMIGGLEALVNFVMTLFALRGTDVFSARNIRQRYRLVIDGATGDGSEHQHDHAGRHHEGAPPGAGWQKIPDE